ncbi:YjbF family lipoprotein [Yoonia sp.]|uniref:YjbF family lipoprotein n=1 Tax=Yoonia sp. TaxID=2212373 RepID=UPI0025DBC1F2|nr:YjbF family lipoprotein [Yoonia sp.]
MKHIRHVMQIMVFCLVAACGNGNDRNLVPQQVLARLAEPKQTPADVSQVRAALTPQVLTAIDGPVLLVQIMNRGAVAVLTRVAMNGPIETFLTPDGISLSLHDGLLVATRGLGFDLMAADVGGPLGAVMGNANDAPREHRYLDGENHVSRDVFDCIYTRSAADHIREICSRAGNAFENTYIVDVFGLVRVSRQWVSEGVGYLLIERWGD